MCLERRFIVEVDGGHHTKDSQIAYDARRDQWLTAEGYHVMRVPNAEVFSNVTGVVDRSGRHCGRDRWCETRDTPTRNAIGLSRPTACEVDVACGRLSPWRSVLPPLRVEGPPSTQGEAE